MANNGGRRTAQSVRPGFVTRIRPLRYQRRVWPIAAAFAAAVLAAYTAAAWLIWRLVEL
jgi:hypothetical protein